MLIIYLQTSIKLYINIPETKTDQKWNLQTKT